MKTPKLDPIADVVTNLLLVKGEVTLKELNRIRGKVRANGLTKACFVAGADSAMIYYIKGKPALWIRAQDALALPLINRMELSLQRRFKMPVTVSHNQLLTLSPIRAVST